MKKISALVMNFIFLGFLVFGQNFSLGESSAVTSVSPAAISVTDRETAIAYMRFAKQCYEQGDFNGALTHSKTGLCYDTGISDLHYLVATSGEKLGMENFRIMESMKTAFENDDWILPNDEENRTFYAEMLCRTNEFAIAIDFLDTEPRIFSANGNFLRAKSLYMLGRGEEAFTIVENSTKIFPGDSRFPLLFFQHEVYDISAKKYDYTSMILRNIAFWGDQDPEIYLAAVPFSESDEERKNFLLAYQASHKNTETSMDLRFIAFALEDGLMGEADAFTFFASSVEKGFKFDDFLAFAELVRDETVAASVEQFLKSFSGTLFFSSNDNGIYDIKAKYEHGRPQKISYDKNQDNFMEWEALCDLGLPSEITVNQGDFFVKYMQFPAVTYVKNSAREKFTIANGAFFWSPLEVQSILLPGNTEFFIPRVHPNTSMFDNNTIFQATTKITVPVNGDSEVCFTISDGKIYRSEYFENGRLYARGIFENGILKTRHVDKTGDGFFEVTEVYEFSPENQGNFMNEAEKKLLYGDLFGSLNVESGLYLKQVQIDSTKNGFPDFIEDYDSRERKIVYWSQDDGKSWIIRHVSDHSEEKLIELSEFKHPITGERIMITSEDGVQTIRADSHGIVPIFRDEQFPLFWVKEVFGSATAATIINECNKNPTKNVCIVTDSEGNVFRVVSSGKLYFAEIVNSKK